MGDATQKLTIVAEAAGTGKTAAELQQVAAAERQVGDAAQQAADQTRESSEAQGKQADTVNQLKRILETLVPGAGRYIEGLRQAANLAGELAGKEGVLIDTGKKLVETLLGNAQALKLLAAGGGVVAGAVALVAAFRAIREEAERVRQAIKGIIEAQDELAKRQADTAQAIESTRDRFKSGPFNEEQARAAAQTVEDLSKKPELKFLFDKEGNASDSLIQAVAAVGGRSDRAGGGGRSIEEIIRIATAIQTDRIKIDPDRIDASIEKTINQGLARSQDAIEGLLARERGQAGEGLRAASGKLGGTGVGVAELEAFARQFTAGTGSDPRTVGMVAQRLPEILDKIAEEFRGFTAPGDREGFKQRISEGVIRDELAKLFRSGEFTVAPGNITDEEIRQARQAVPQLIAEVKRLSEAVDKLGDAAVAPRTVVNNNQFSRNTYPDARAVREATKNGESQRARLER